MTADAAFTEIPVVDLGRWHRGSADERASFAREIADICHHVGFFVAVNHGVDAELTGSLFSTMARFFDLPVDTKATIDKQHSRHFRGWEPVGSESTNNRVDMREQIDLWTDMPAQAADVEPAYRRLIGPNQWLDEAVLPGARATIEAWIDAQHQVALNLLEIFCLGLGLDDAQLRGHFGDGSMSLTKLIHYPPTPADTAGVNAHHDAGFVTLLDAGNTPGLEVLNGDDQWIPVPNIEGGLVVNIGEMLQAMTGNYFVATAHRVITAEERLSAGHFLGPRLDTPLTPLPLAPRFAEAVAASPRHANAGFMAQADETDAGVADMSSPHAPDVYGNQLWNYFVRSYPKIVELHYPHSVPGSDHVHAS